MIYTIKHPLAGFENTLAMDLSQIDDLFYKLQSQEEEDISFTLIDPFQLRSYEFELPNFYSILLEITENTKFKVLTSMIVTNPPENSTINFMAPFIFNEDKHFMLQALLDIAKYPQYGITEGIDKFLDQ